MIIKKLGHWVKQFESFHWLSHQGIKSLIPCSRSMLRARSFGRPSNFFFAIFLLGAFSIKHSRLLDIRGL